MQTVKEKLKELKPNEQLVFDSAFLLNVTVKSTKRAIFTKDGMCTVETFGGTKRTGRAAGHALKRSMEQLQQGYTIHIEKKEPCNG